MKTSFARAVGKLMLIVFSTAFFTTPGRTEEAPLRQLEIGLSDLIYRLSRSIVAIEASHPVSGFLPGSNDRLVQTAVSTGLVYDSTGRILASASAVAGYDQIQVTGEERSVEAHVAAVDYRNDLAILIPDMPVGAPVDLGNPSVCAGQMVISLANAYGLRASPSLGFCGGSRSDGTLQFSLPTASSAVGGGVFDLSGNLLGMVVGDLGEPGRMAVAISARKLPGIVNYLLKNGSRQAGFMGVTSRSITIEPPVDLENIGAPPTQSQVGVRADHLLEHGVLIVDVVPGSPAAQAGIQIGDLILEMDGKRVQGSTDLAEQVTDLQPGQTVSVKFVRRTSIFTTRLQIGQRPVAHAPQAQSEEVGRRRVADSLYQELNRLKDQMSRVEQRLQSIE